LFSTQRGLEVAVRGSLRLITKEILLHVREAQAQRMERGIEINGDSVDKLLYTGKVLLRNHWFGCYKHIIVHAIELYGHMV